MSTSPTSLERTASSLDEKFPLEAGSPGGETAGGEKRSWYRSPLCQVNIVGACAFLSPGPSLPSSCSPSLGPVLTLTLYSQACGTR